MDATDVFNTQSFTDRTTKLVHLGRLDLQWLTHASLFNMTRLLYQDGVQYDLKSASFAAGKTALGDALIWIGSAQEQCASHQERSTIERFISQRLGNSRDYATLCCTAFLTY